MAVCADSLDSLAFLQVTQSRGLDVVYGDTDSIFVNSGSSDYREAAKIAAETQKELNKMWRLLEVRGRTTVCHVSPSDATPCSSVLAAFLHPHSSRVGPCSAVKVANVVCSQGVLLTLGPPFDFRLVLMASTARCSSSTRRSTRAFPCLNAMARSSRRRRGWHSIRPLLCISAGGILPHVPLQRFPRLRACCCPGLIHFRPDATLRKGIDIVRRDWCVLAKRAGDRVLDFILSGQPVDEVRQFAAWLHFQRLQIIQVLPCAHLFAMKAFAVLASLISRP